MRLLIAVPIATLVIADHSELAMALFVTAGATDAVDGWLAKRFGWQTQLGGWLDPLADKALVMSMCVALALHGDLPFWLLGLIVLRDIVIVSGAIAFHFNFEPLHAAPTLLGKLTTLTLLLLVVILLWRNMSADVASWLVSGLIYLSAALLLVSGADYVRHWSAKARKVSRNRTNPMEPRS